MKEQAVAFQADILQALYITQVGSDGQYRSTKTASSEEYCASALLLALGTTYLQLNVPG
jgi:thioredoxin reductase